MIAPIFTLRRMVAMSRVVLQKHTSRAAEVSVSSLAKAAGLRPRPATREGNRWLPKQHVRAATVHRAYG